MYNNKIFASVQEKIIPIVSGGLDSTTMLFFLAANGYKIEEVLTFNYAQKHKVETKYAKKVIARFSEQNYDVSHKVVDISNIGEMISQGALTGDAELPKQVYDVETQKITVVPNRNMIFLSIAAARAITLKIGNIGYAAHASDYSVYPDCRPEFIEAIDKALLLGNLWDPVHLIAPFKHLSKTEIVKLGLEINVPFELTWSCYLGGDRPCLECGTCLERTESFHNNNVVDPALTTKEWKRALKSVEIAKQNKILNHKE